MQASADQEPRQNQRSEQAINPRVENPGEAAAGPTVTGGRVEPVLRRAASGRRRCPGRRRGRVGLPRGRRGRGRRGPHAPRGAAQSLAHGPPGLRPPAAASGRWRVGDWGWIRVREGGGRGARAREAAAACVVRALVGEVICVLSIELRFSFQF